LCYLRTDSVLASWADAIDGNGADNGTEGNTAVGDSDLSSNSDSSDPDASFFAEADFAVAVARAAELSGLTVVGSTVMDPGFGPREKGLLLYFDLRHCNVQRFAPTVG
jgi:hypothetical protein